MFNNKTKIRKILIVLIIIFSLLLFSRVKKHNDYYYNCNSDYTFDGELVKGFETNNLNKGAYFVELEYNISKPVKVEIILNDTAEIISTSEISSNDSLMHMDFSINQTVKGVSLKIYCNEETAHFGEACYQSTEPVYTDRYIISILIALTCAGIIKLFKNKNKNIIIILGLVLFVSLPFINGRLQSGHDLYFHLDRIFNIGLQISKGNLIPRINEASTSSPGSIVPLMYPDFMLYFSGLLVFFKGSVMLAYKILVIEINILTGFIAYYVSKKMFNNKVGLLFAFFYLLNPYRLNEIFIRAAIGEALAMAFIPLAFYGVYLLLQSNYRKGFFISVFGITLLFQSHLLGTYIFLIFASIYFVVYIIFNGKTLFKDKSRVTYFFLAIIVTLLLNSYFVIPFLKFYDSNFYISSKYNYLGGDSCEVYRLFESGYNLGYSRTGMSVSVGPVALFGLIVTIYELYFNKNYIYSTFGYAFLALGLLGILLSSNIFPWEHIQSIPYLEKMVSILQFPWRFQIMSCLFINAVISLTITQLSKDKEIVSFVLVILCILTSINCLDGYQSLNSTKMENKSDEYGDGNNIDYYRLDKDINITTYTIFNRVINSNNKDAIFYYNQNKNKQYVFYENVNCETIVDIPIYYYDGLYKVYINDELSKYSCSDLNTISLVLSGEKSEGYIRVEINNDNFLIGDLLSITTLISVIFLHIKYKKEEKLISSK